MADAAITLSIGLPDNPLNPSNHAATSAGMAPVLGKRFPAEASRLDALADEAALPQVYHGMHYRFDRRRGSSWGGRSPRIRWRRT